MTFEDYIKGWGNHEKYLKETYGDSAKSVWSAFVDRLSVNLNSRFTVVQEIESMVFGQFIMMERALTSGMKEQEAIFRFALAVIRPPEDREEFDNTDKDKEAAHVEDLLSANAKDILEAVTRVIELRDDFIHNKYAGVFYKEETEDEKKAREDGDDDDEENGIDDLEKRFNKDFYWHSIVHQLANKDILKHDMVLMTPMSVVAPHLAYLRMMGLIEYKQRKAEEMAAKIRNNIR